jgi:hypothetical protein
MNILTADVSKDAHLRFKRVENFKEMDSQSSMITEIYDRTGDYRQVVEALISNFKMTQEEALIRLSRYRSEHQVINEKILENPGFAVTFKMLSMKNELKNFLKNMDRFRSLLAGFCSDFVILFLCPQVLLKWISNYFYFTLH